MIYWIDRVEDRHKLACGSLVLPFCVSYGVNRQEIVLGHVAILDGIPATFDKDQQGYVNIENQLLIAQLSNKTNISISELNNKTAKEIRELAHENNMKKMQNLL